jgi:hypothetical protein
MFKMVTVVVAVLCAKANEAYLKEFLAKKEVARTPPAIKKPKTRMETAIFPRVSKKFIVRKSELEPISKIGRRPFPGFSAREMRSFSEEYVDLPRGKSRLSDGKDGKGRGSCLMSYFEMGSRLAPILPTNNQHKKGSYAQEVKK